MTFLFISRLPHHLFALVRRSFSEGWNDETYYAKSSTNSTPA